MNEVVCIKSCDCVETEEAWVLPSVVQRGARLLVLETKNVFDEVVLGLPSDLESEEFEAVYYVPSRLFKTCFKETKKENG